MWLIVTMVMINDDQQQGRIKERGRFPRGGNPSSAFDHKAPTHHRHRHHHSHHRHHSHRHHIFDGAIALSGAGSPRRQVVPLFPASRRIPLPGSIQNGTKTVTTSHKLHKITGFSDTFRGKTFEHCESCGKYYASLFTQMASKLFFLALHQMRRNFGKCPNLRERLLMKRPFVWWGPICGADY